MNKKFIVNDNVMFSFDENKLTPLGPRGTEVILHAPVSRFLLLLIQKNGDIVEQEEIYKEVWEKYGQRVTSSTLYQNVSLLRKSLKKAGIHTPMIKTYPKAGFSFRGSVQILEDSQSTQTMREEYDQGQQLKENVASVATSPQMVEGSPDKVPPKKRTWLIVAIVILLASAAAVAAYLYQRSLKTSEEFVNTQDIIARVNGCPVYLDRENKGVDLSKVISYLRENIPRCPADNFLYVTKNPVQEQVVVMQCDSSDDDTKCHLAFRLPPYLFPRP